jgi:hypothetical protein
VVCCSRGPLSDRTTSGNHDAPVALLILVRCGRVRFVGEAALFRAVRPGPVGTPDGMVRVDWLRTRSREQAFWKPGMYANQNSVTRLRQRFTHEELTREFDLDTPDDDEDAYRRTGGDVSRPAPGWWLRSSLGCHLFRPR